MYIPFTHAFNEPKQEIPEKSELNTVLCSKLLWLEEGTANGIWDRPNMSNGLGGVKAHATVWMVPFSELGKRGGSPDVGRHWPNNCSANNNYPTSQPGSPVWFTKHSNTNDRYNNEHLYTDLKFIDDAICVLQQACELARTHRMPFPFCRWGSRVSEGLKDLEGAVGRSSSGWGFWFAVLWSSLSLPTLLLLLGWKHFGARVRGWGDNVAFWLRERRQQPLK